MNQVSESTPPNPRRNSIGALRLLFASLVIVSHSPEMLDGDKRREPLHQLFGSLTFGGLAVDAFFLISGYLIAASFAASSGVGSYFQKRVLRIYPAFLVCSLLCILVVAPLGGAHLQALDTRDWSRIATRLVMLKSPEIEGAFEGRNYQALNGSAWTISYEFRCYILAALFGLVGLYRRRWIFAGLTAVLILGNFLFLLPAGQAVADAPGWFDALFGEPEMALRLLDAFIVGTCFWLFRDRIAYRADLAVLCAVGALGLMLVPALAEIGLIILGGYVLFYVAFKASWKPLLTINAKDDISYGVYLYAWPVAALIIWTWPGIPVVALGLVTFAAAVALGALSWRFIEKPALALKGRVRPAGAATAKVAEPKRG
ncbi:MAG: acyltransferase 3 [Phenylobacterium sp.]|nr:acyltransferase 3 [Phenylobacterium sp.]